MEILILNKLFFPLIDMFDITDSKLKNTPRLCNFCIYSKLYDKKIIYYKNQGYRTSVQ